MIINVKCPCGSNKRFKSCCDRYISGTKHAPIAEALMRSRYSAYVLGNVDYIKATWAEQTKPNIDFVELEKSLQNIEYLNLKIISKIGGTRKSDHGQVEFMATFNSINGEETLHELSNFVKIVGQWFYVDGNVSIS